jgi:hypothetical protein
LLRLFGVRWLDTALDIVERVLPSQRIQSGVEPPHSKVKDSPMNLITTTLTADELERLLTEADPAAVLVPPRILRRVIKKHGHVVGLGLQVPHRKSYVLGREELFAVAGPDELGLAPGRRLPDVVLLLPRPQASKLAAVPAELTLRKYWRLLFHARVHAALRQRRGGALDEDAVRDRVRRLGLTEFAEAAAVLREEHFLLPPGDDATTYEEFAALYLELRYFAPDKLPRYFPGVDAGTAERVLAEDVDAEALFRATRLPGAADPDCGLRIADCGLENQAGTSRERAASPSPISESAIRNPQSAIAEAEAKGNLVRAAVLCVRAGRADAAERLVGRLVERLQAALHFSSDDAAAWRRGLAALLGPASRGTWPVAARLLYDLQKICVDHERAIYAVDVTEWVVSWGQRPVKRLLPYQGDVLAVKHLRAALRRLGSDRIDHETRHELEPHLHNALERAAERLRERLRPVVVRTLDEVEMTPATAAETVARDKVVEELLDLVEERGFLNLGDLRDAIARNRLKLPDLAGPREFFLGDRLIRANRRFAESLDGVYRRGEIYLRWLQRVNSVAFGTAVGRFLTRYFVLPFGCAYVALEGLQHLLHLALRLTGVIRFDHLPAVAGAVGLPAVAAHGPRPYLASREAVVALGVFILAMLYLPRFRRGVVRGLHGLLRGATWLLYDLPALVFRVPFVRAFLASRLWLYFGRFVVKPLSYSLALCLVYVLGVFFATLLWALVRVDLRTVAQFIPFYHRAFPPPSPLFTFLMVTALPYLWIASFLATAVLVNLPVGPRLEEIAADYLVRGWRRLSADLFPGLFRWVMLLFRRLLEGVERIIYTVDEWLRFRQGDSELSFYVKVVLGTVWSAVTYVVRFVVNLLIEPQINPIKHFPVVTVSHKLVLTLLVPPLTQALALTMEPALAATVALTVGFCIPGVFGFLVWELKENWKMYRANQSPTLDAEVVGSHGETVPRLLRPGFHSGTLPKLYAKLRHAADRSLRKPEEGLHHVAESVRHLVERTLLATLAGSRRWGLGPALRVASVRCGCNRIRVELACAPLPGEALLLDLEEHAGWLVAGVARRGWLAALSAEQTEAWTAALAGFYKFAGADLVREQVAALLPPEATFTVTEAGLVVWLGDAEGRYDLDDTETLEPVIVRGPLALPRLKRQEVLFGEAELRWADWVETWENDRAGKRLAASPASAFSARRDRARGGRG